MRLIPFANVLDYMFSFTPYGLRGPRSINRPILRIIFIKSLRRDACFALKTIYNPGHFFFTFTWEMFENKNTKGDAWLPPLACGFQSFSFWRLQYKVMYGPRRGWMTKCCSTESVILSEKLTVFRKTTDTQFHHFTHQMRLNLERSYKTLLKTKSIADPSTSVSLLHISQTSLCTTYFWLTRTWRFKRMDSPI